VLSLFRQRLYQIIAGYEDANDADRLRHDPALQILADQPLGEPLGSQPTLSRWENSPAPRDLLKLQHALLDWFVKICGKQARKRGEILLDVDSTDDPTHGQQQLSFFHVGYDQHMYHPLEQPQQVDNSWVLGSCCSRIPLWTSCNRRKPRIHPHQFV
jgi:hypothetical protein